MSVSKSDAFPGGLPEIIGLGSSSLVLTGLKKRRINLMFTGYKEKLQTTLIDYICILHNANLAGKKKKIKSIYIPVLGAMQFGDGGLLCSS